MQDRTSQDRTSMQTGGSSSASSSRPRQTQLGGRGYASRTTYLQDTAEHESVIANLVSPPSPPSLDQIFSAGPGNSSSQRPIQAPSASSPGYQSYQSLYDSVERELFSSPQANAGASPTRDANSNYQSLYDGSAQALSAAPGSSGGDTRQQSAANESTSGTSQESYSHYPGISYNKVLGKWRVRPKDPATRSRVSLGHYSTRSEAIKRMEDYRASQSELFAQQHPGVRKRNGKWLAKCYFQGKQIHVGTFDTQEEAERALDERRAEYGLPSIRRST